MSLIFLTGMPASGKSHWAKIWSERYNYELYDTDKIIEEEMEISVAEIFSVIGEHFFRDKEEELIRDVVHNAQKNSVIACGGGLPVYNDNMAFMLQHGCVVYLDAPIEVLVEQHLKSNVVRPLLKIGDPHTKLLELLSKRESIYRQAHIILKSENLSDTTFAQIIEACTDRH